MSARIRVLPAPFVSSAAVGGGHTRTTGRRGVLLEVVRADGRAATGEASPFPGLSTETMEDVVRGIERLRLPDGLDDRGGLAATVEGYLGESNDVLAQLPSLRFALETVVARWLCADRACDLASVVADGAPSHGVDVACLLGAPTQAGQVDEARVAVADGFGTLKLKLSTTELGALAAVRDAIGPAPRLRVDFNGAGRLADLPSIGPRLVAAGVELCEDPVPVAEMRDARLEGVPLFWDEGVGDHVDAAMASGVAGVVLKPTILGGFVRSRAIAARARSVGKRVVVTHAFESTVGLLAVRALAHAVPPGEAHGVDRHPLVADVPRAPRLTRST